jgi:rubrerythrin
MKNAFSNRDKLVERLQSAIDAENTTFACCRRLASIIKNGRIRNRFYSFAESARADDKLLRGQLNKLGINNFDLEERCRFCKIDPEGFSLSGAINLGLEVTRVAIISYRDLCKLSDTQKDKRLFKRLLEEKTRQNVFLKKEKGFVRKQDKNLSCIDNYCIPEIISRLSK